VQIHTIFMLSIADLLLAVMWVVGGAMWMSGGIDHTNHNRVGCFTVLLMTVVSASQVVYGMNRVYSYFMYTDEPLIVDSS